jgi:NTE family protein
MPYEISRLARVQRDSVMSTSPTNIPEPSGDEPRVPAYGLALALSGGGYRAMLFHAGVLIRLNEMGLLAKLSRISSVSGGSITAAFLGLKWKDLNFDTTTGIADNFIPQVIAPLRAFACITVDVKAVLTGALIPGISVSDRVIAAYRRFLFGEATLQNLPDDRVPDHSGKKPPRFVINATNVQTGTLMRFSRPYLADYSIGMVKKPEVPLAVAVAASSAFPPFLSPLVLACDRMEFDATVPAGRDFIDPKYRENVTLTDGGVYDNLGIETVWKRYRHVLVSDAGQKMRGELEPKKNWLLHLKRTFDVVDNQVRSLRKRQILDAFTNPNDVHKGAYWSIKGNLADYPVLRTGDGDRAIADACDPFTTRRLAMIPTRLAQLQPEDQDHLCNWGYAACDAGIRAWCQPFLSSDYGVTVTPPNNFPFPLGLASRQVI